MKNNNKIVKRKDDFSKWYTSVILNSNLVEYGLVKGTMILKPYGFNLWENIKNKIDYLLSEKNVLNCALPTFIPYNEFAKEVNHIKGFSPEIFKVTELNDKKLDEAYVIRPTSEISFCHYFKNNINSYNDLPVKLNQWCNVFRVEKNTRPFLRTSEFYWQEQHSAFSTLKEAKDFSKEIIFLYKNFVENELAIPVIMGYKTDREKFAGAIKTYSIEGIMQDGQVIQCATSHNLGQNFSLSFKIKYQNIDNKYEYVFQTSAGISTRIIGSLIMTHSDDNGLIIPPKIAPIQVKINTIFSEKEPKVLLLAEKIKKTISKTRIFIDDSKKQLGYKIKDGEIKGIPIQINLGPKNILNNEVEIIIRNKNEKNIFLINKLNQKLIDDILFQLHNELYLKAKKNQIEKIKKINNFSELSKILDDKNVAFGYWSGDCNDEDFIKNKTGATARCLVVGKKQGKCFFTKKMTNIKAYFGRAY